MSSGFIKIGLVSMPVNPRGISEALAYRATTHGEGEYVGDVIVESDDNVPTAARSSGHFERKNETSGPAVIGSDYGWCIE